MDPILLTNTVKHRLAKYHGGEQRAVAFRQRLHNKVVQEQSDVKMHNRVLVVSDLHLGAGRDGETHAIHCGDEFTSHQERQFSSYLANEWKCAHAGNVQLMKASESKVNKTFKAIYAGTAMAAEDVKLKKSHPYKITLALNGDIFDFLQTVVQKPEFKYPDGYSPQGFGPKNTPANIIMQLNMIRAGHSEFFATLAKHLMLGHEIDIIPGNHDRQLLNDHVWQGGVYVAGKYFHGFKGIVGDELSKLNLDEQTIANCLQRLHLKPFAIYGDTLVAHGHCADPYNRVQRPLKEFLYSSDLHDNMSLSLGDYAVRTAFSKVELDLPDLDNYGTCQKEFRKMLIQHPRHLFSLMAGFFRAIAQEGYALSKIEDEDQRLRDMATLVQCYPELCQAIRNISGNENLTVEEMADKMILIEKQTAIPFFSNFKANGHVETRMLKYILGAGRKDAKRSVLKQLDLANKYFGINNFICGHTHRAENDLYLTQRQTTVRYINDHTWMDRLGKWGRAQMTWGSKSRGVATVNIVKDTDGRTYSDASLQKVVGENGYLVEGDILELPDKNKKKSIKALTRMCMNKL